MSVILATAGYDHKVKFWEAPSAVTTKTLPFPDSQVNRLEITPDKQFLAAAGNPHIRLYEINGAGGGSAGAAAHGPVLSCEGHTSNVTGIGFQIHGRWMYSGSEDGTVKVFDLRSPSYQRSFNAKSPIRTVALHPNQLQLISGDSSGSVKVWDLRKQSGYINSIVPDTAMFEEDQEPYETNSQQPYDSMHGSREAQAMDRDQYNGQDGIQEEESKQERPSSAFGAITQSSGSSGLMSSHQSNDNISEHSNSNCGVRGVGPASASDPQNSGGQQNMHSAASDASIKRKQPIIKDEVAIQAITINEHYIIAANNHAQVFVWDHFGSHASPSALAAMGHNSHHHHPHGEMATSQPNLRHNNTAVSICNLRPVKAFNAHPPGSYCLQAKLSPDGRHLVTTGSDWTARLWDTSTWGLSSTLARHTKWVWDAVFSADSSYLVTASSDATARLWNLRSGDVVRQYNGHQGAVTCVALNDNST